MSDTTIIWEAMSVMVNEDHPIIYQYVKGKALSRNSAIIRLTKMVAPIFIGAYNTTKIKSVSKQYLNQMESNYKQNKIKIKPIYS